MHHHHPDRTGRRLLGAASVTFAALALLAGLAGCAAISGSRPHDHSIPSLPEDYRVDGTAGRRVWLESNRIAGFALGWTEPDSLAPGYPLNSPGHARLGPPPDTICLEMRVFARFRAERRLGRNQLLLTLADGSTVRSVDLWLGPAPGPGGHWGVASVTPVRFAAADDPGMRGRDLDVFVPRWAARQEVVAVERVYDLAMRVVPERRTIVSGAPVCGYVSLDNRSDQPITLVLNETLNFHDSVLSLTGPDGRFVNCSKTGLNINYAPGEGYHDIPAGGSLRLPFFLMRADDRMLFDEPGRYEIGFADPSFRLSAHAKVEVTAPTRPEPRYHEFFAKYRSLNGVFSWGDTYVEKLRAWRDELGPASEYAEAASMIVDYYDGGHSVGSLLRRDYLWQLRMQEPPAVAALRRPRSYNVDLWAYIRASVAAGRPTPVDGATYYDACRHFL